MNKEKDQQHNDQDKKENTSGRPQQHSSAFNEQSTKDQKSTSNIEEEAGLEQERKDAMTERD